MRRRRRSTSLALLLICSACTSSKPAERPTRPQEPADYLIDSGEVADLQRGDIQIAPAERLGELDNGASERWVACGVKSAAAARYASSVDSTISLTATVVEFSDPRAAFCGFTPGRSTDSSPVPDLETAFEQIDMARALRGAYVVEVRAAQPDLLRMRTRAVLGGIIAKFPAQTQVEIPGSSLLPENTLVPGSERIVPTEVLPTFEVPAVVADVQCGDKAQAHVIIIEYDSAEAASAALEAYQGVSLENFMEVAPFEHSGAKGIRIKGEKGTNVLFQSQAHLVGLIDAKSLKPCDEALTELAVRAAPLDGGGEEAPPANTEAGAEQTPAAEAQESDADSAESGAESSEPAASGEAASND